MVIFIRVENDYIVINKPSLPLISRMRMKNNICCMNLINVNSYISPLLSSCLIFKKKYKSSLFPPLLIEVLVLNRQSESSYVAVLLLLSLCLYH